MDISAVTKWAEAMMRKQVEQKADVLDPIRERYRAMDLTRDDIDLELTYDEATALKAGWLPTLAFALGMDRIAAEDVGVAISETCTVTVRGPGLHDWPIKFDPLD